MTQAGGHRQEATILEQGTESTGDKQRLSRNICPRKQTLLRGWVEGWEKTEETKMYIRGWGGDRAAWGRGRGSMGDRVGLLMHKEETLLKGTLSIRRNASGHEVLQRLLGHRRAGRRVPGTGRGQGEPASTELGMGSVEQ